MENVKLSELKAYNDELYTELLCEILKQDGYAWIDHYVKRDSDLNGVVVFKDTTRGNQGWWQVIEDIQRARPEPDYKLMYNKLKDEFSECMQNLEFNIRMVSAGTITSDEFYDAVHETYNLYQSKNI